MNPKENVNAQTDLDQIKEESFSGGNSLLKNPENGSEGGQNLNGVRSESNSARIGGPGSQKGVFNAGAGQKELS